MRLFLRAALVGGVQLFAVAFVVLGAWTLWPTSLATATAPLAVLSAWWWGFWRVARAYRLAAVTGALALALALAALVSVLVLPLSLDAETAAFALAAGLAILLTFPRAQLAAAWAAGESRPERLTPPTTALVPRPARRIAAASRRVARRPSLPRPPARRRVVALAGASTPDAWRGVARLDPAILAGCTLLLVPPEVVVTGKQAEAVALEVARRTGLAMAEPPHASVPPLTALAPLGRHPDPIAALAMAWQAGLVPVGVLESGGWRWLAGDRTGRTTGDLRGVLASLALAAPAITPEPRLAALIARTLAALGGPVEVPA